MTSGEELFRVNATDNDEGRNADLKYFILETNVPFVIGETDGRISIGVDSGLDYEKTTSYTVVLYFVLFCLLLTVSRI